MILTSKRRSYCLSLRESTNQLPGYESPMYDVPTLNLENVRHTEEANLVPRAFSSTIVEEKALGTRLRKKPLSQCSIRLLY